MDPIRNPFAPGAGKPPPELAGRKAEIDQIDLLMRRVEVGRSEQSLLISGLRGVGKTVLLNRFREQAEERKWSVSLREMRGPRDHPQPFRDLMADMCRQALMSLGRDQQINDIIKRALGALRSFRLNVTVSNSGEVEYSLGIEPLAGIADSGQLDVDLGELFVELGRVARAKKKGVLLLLDEVQGLSQPDLAALIMALHQVDQRNLPVTAVAAGLPQLPELVGEAKSYAERLFEFHPIGQLSEPATRQAFMGADETVEWADQALDLLVKETDRYPHFIQEWGRQSWFVAERSPITADDVRRARGAAIKALDDGFFRIRYNRATKREREYLTVMAKLGHGPYRSGEIAQKMGKRQESLGMVRDSLIHKGLIYVPEHGALAFTVPHFDEYVRRVDV